MEESREYFGSMVIERGAGAYAEKRLCKGGKGFVLFGGHCGRGAADVMKG